MPIYLTAWSYSHARFAMKMPTERSEAILAGMVEAFSFYGCVPREVWIDNPTTVATAILKGRARQLHERYAALASHYAFEPNCCMPASGWEKPDVEHSVFNLQRWWATPVPRVKDDNELNAYLLRCCIEDMDRKEAGQTQTIRERFAQDKACAAELPKHHFDPCVYETAKIDKYQTAAYDTNRYSVPRAYAFQTVGIKAYIDRVQFTANGAVIASWWRWTGVRRRWITRRSTATGSFRPSSPIYARGSNSVSAPTRAPGSTSASFSFCPCIRSSVSSSPSN